MEVTTAYAADWPHVKRLILWLENSDESMNKKSLLCTGLMNDVATLNPNATMYLFVSYIKFVISVNTMTFSF